MTDPHADATGTAPLHAAMTELLALAERERDLAHAMVARWGDDIEAARPYFARQQAFAEVVQFFERPAIRDLLVAALTPSAPKEPAPCQHGECEHPVVCQHYGCLKAAPTPSPEGPATALEMELRQTWWLSHGHVGLYGDDGEMQCSACAPFGAWDYKRAPLQTLRDTLCALNVYRLANPVPVPDALPARGPEALAPPLSGDSPGAWQDIATAPKDGSWFLSFTPQEDIGEHWNTQEVARWHNGEFRSSDGVELAPTRWQPLPSPPPASPATQEPR